MSTPSHARHSTLRAIPFIALAFSLASGCNKQLAAAPPPATTRTALKSIFAAITDHQPKLGDHFTQRLINNTERFELTFIPAGEFLMGSPNNEPGRDKNEGPQYRVSVNSFWMARQEVTADLVMLWLMESTTAQRAAAGQKVDTPLTPTALRAAA